MRQLLIFCILLMFTIGCPAILFVNPVKAFQDQPGDDFKDKAEKLFYQLESESLLERRKAAKQLTKMGPGILELLDESDFEFSEDAVMLINVIRTRLQLELSQSVMRGSKITLKGAMSLSEAFHQLSKQSGNKIIGYQDRNAEIDLDCENEDFWVVFDDVLDQAGLTINPYGARPGEINVAARPETQIDRSDAANYVGAFRIEVIRCESVRDYISPVVDHCRMTLQVNWEPRLQPIALKGAMSDVAVIDENDEPVSVKGRDSVISATVQPEIAKVEIAVPFDLVDRDVRKISRLRATMMAIIPGRKEMFKFKNLDKIEPGTEITKANATVTFGGVQKNVDVYTIAIQLKFDNANNALESHRGWVLQNEVYLIDKDGKKSKPIGLETRRQSGNEVVINYIFDKAPGDSTLIYRSPAVIFKMPLEIDLRDIDLP